MKSLFIVLLAVAIAQACEPGTLFQKSCNLCKCLPDGKSIACTDKLCPEDHTNTETTDQICTPNSLFKSDCNICKCSPNGKLALCTEMKCPEYQNYVNTDVKEQFCEPLKVFKLDDFNTCICNRDGTRAMCTLSSSLPNANALSTESFTKNGQYCTPGTTFKLDECNTCKCSYDGTKALCNLSICPDNKFNSINEPKQVCKPKSTFMNYCNTCICSKDGTNFACTQMSCDENIWNEDGTMKTIPKPYFYEEPAQKQVCKPLSQFKEYCNTCLCSADGMRYACTDMYCNENLWFKNGTRKVPDQVCTPNTHFKEYCNACVCSKDGLSKFCTMKECDENIYNKDGSLKIKPFTSNKVCDPKSTFSPDGCNTCICNKQGTQYDCTMKACDDYEVSDVTGSKNWGPKYKQGDACTPGKLFYSECNSCICSKNGLSAFCTLMDC